MERQGSVSHREGPVMEEYIRFVERSAGGPFPSLILQNRDLEHASIVFATLFKISKKNIQIITGDLHEQVYGSEIVLSATREFFEKSGNVAVEILHEHSIDFRNHRWFSHVLANRWTSKVSVCSVPLSEQNKYDCHFCVCDSKHYRLEGVKGSHEAFVQFGEAAVSKQLQEVFSKIKRLSRADDWAGSENAGGTNIA